MIQPGLCLKRLRFRLRDWFAFTLVLAVALGFVHMHRQHEWLRIDQLVGQRDSALSEWRRVYVRYEQRGQSEAEAELTSRELYFQRRQEVAAAKASAWWKTP